MLLKLPLSPIRSSGVLALALCVGVALFFSACSKKPAGPPTTKAVRYLPDPYPSVPVRGEVSDIERAAAVLERVGKDLGYGAVPGEVLRGHAREKWAIRHRLFLAHGETASLRAAWVDMVDTWTQNPAVNMDSKLQLHLGLGRVWDLEGEKAPEEVLRSAYLAEMAYGYLLLHQDSVQNSKNSKKSQKVNAGK